MEEEVFASGFCKAQNQTRSILCEVLRKDDGSIEVLESDCAYGTCPHSTNCVLMRSVWDPDR